MKRALAASTRKQAKSTSVRAAMHNSVITMRSIKSMAARCSLCIAVGCFPPNWLLQTYPDVRHPESCLSSWWASIEMPRLQAGTAGCEEAAPPGTVNNHCQCRWLPLLRAQATTASPDQHSHIKAHAVERTDTQQTQAHRHKRRHRHTDTQQTHAHRHRPMQQDVVELT